VDQELQNGCPWPRVEDQELQDGCLWPRVGDKSCKMAANGHV
jgi:hypothetical protein